MPAPPLTRADAVALRRCLGAGGVALFPSDTVYGLACADDSPAAVARLRALKGRSEEKPLAIMAFSAQAALALVPWAGPRTRAAMTELLPGPVTLVLDDPEGRHRVLRDAGDAAPRTPGAPSGVGLRVPRLPYGLSALAGVGRAFAQSSANLAGGPAVRRLSDVHPSLRARVDLVLDGGELPGIASTVVDLRRYETEGVWSVLREGAVGVRVLRRTLGAGGAPAGAGGAPAGASGSRAGAVESSRNG